MLLNFSVPGQVSIGMGKMVQDFLDEVAVDGRAESPVWSYEEFINNKLIKYYLYRRSRI